MRKTDLPRGFSSNRREDYDLSLNEILPRALFGDTSENLRMEIGRHLNPIKSISSQKNTSLNKRVIAVVDALLTPGMNEIHFAESNQRNALQAKRELLSQSLCEGVYGVDANDIKELLFRLLEFQEGEKNDTAKNIRKAFRRSLGELGITNREEYDKEQRYYGLMTELPPSLEGNVEDYSRNYIRAIIDDPSVILAITEGQNLDRSKASKPWSSRVNNTVSARKEYISMVGDMLFTGEEYDNDMVIEKRLDAARKEALEWVKKNGNIM